MSCGTANRVSGPPAACACALQRPPGCKPTSASKCDSAAPPRLDVPTVGTLAPRHHGHALAAASWVVRSAVVPPAPMVAGPSADGAGASHVVAVPPQGPAPSVAAAPKPSPSPPFSG